MLFFAMSSIFFMVFLVLACICFPSDIQIVNCLNKQIINITWDMSVVNILSLMGSSGINLSEDVRVKLEIENFFRDVCGLDLGFVSN